MSHVKNEQCAGAVVAVALPHFGEEQGGKAARVAEETRVGVGGDWCG